MHIYTLYLYVFYVREYDAPTSGQVSARERLAARPEYTFKLETVLCLVMSSTVFNSGLEFLLPSTLAFPNRIESFTGFKFKLHANTVHSGSSVA